MAYVNNFKELLAYKNRVQIELELLPVGMIFNAIEKDDLSTIYKFQLEIIENAIQRNVSGIEFAEPFTYFPE